MLKLFKPCLSLTYLRDYLQVYLLLQGSGVQLKIWVIIINYGCVEG